MKYSEKFYFKRIILGRNALYISFKDWEHTPCDQDLAEQELALEKHRESLVSFIKTTNSEGKTIMYLDNNLMTPDDFLIHCHS
jgi:hypothetical protein